MSNLPQSIVYIVDDDVSVREALSDLLESVGIKSVLYTSADDFLSSPRLDCPSCLILDVRMPGQSGLELQNTLNAMKISIPILFITAHGDIPMSVRALKNGAVDFLTKPFSDQVLLDSLHSALEWHKAERERYQERCVLQERYESLNVGEREVFRLVVRGLLNKQIAGLLGVSEITVKVRRGHVMRKMACNSLACLVRAHDYLFA
nr:response regulator transcription factor [uncultured Neokomagataea sp.]